MASIVAETPIRFGKGSAFVPDQGRTHPAPLGQLSPTRPGLVRKPLQGRRDRVGCRRWSRGRAVPAPGGASSGTRRHANPPRPRGCMSSIRTPTKNGLARSPRTALRWERHCKTRRRWRARRSTHGSSGHGGLSYFI